VDEVGLDNLSIDKPEVLPRIALVRRGVTKGETDVITLRLQRTRSPLSTFGARAYDVRGCQDEAAVANPEPCSSRDFFKCLCPCPVLAYLLYQ